MAQSPDADSILPYFFAGLCGFAGVILLASGSHGQNTGQLTLAGQFLLFHAPAVMVVASQKVFAGVYKRAAIALLLIGSAVFSIDLALKTFSPNMAVGILMPIGGGMTILGWLCIAIGAIRRHG